MSVWSAYCDGSGTSESDSPACVGVVLCDPDGNIVCESSAYICVGTNNVAELWAVRRALYLIRWCTPARAATPAVIITDSRYAIGCARGEYVAKKNVELVREIQEQVAKHGEHLTFRHVHGHNGDPGNELADWLAGIARSRHLAREHRHPRPTHDHRLELTPRGGRTAAGARRK